ncbi:signal peptidase I [Enterococcus asini]|uniref:signal peptidase I n=1 Tax=Enterococcus asini TaxID=57732 RepID=UPI002890885D|nr:signal peptidase I [Enterococcus asini]MDT2757836.1 signal peptidase I [Enterococcus asini]
MKKEWLKTILYFGGLLIVLWLLRQFVFTPVIVKGDSMDPTLHNDERVIALLNFDVERFDIVTFPAPDEPGKNYIKRVIGLPKEVVEYRNDTLFIDGEAVEEPYLDQYKKELTDGLPLTLGNGQQEIFSFGEIPPGKVLVLGDNRRISKDSRSIGFIEKDQLSGDVKLIFWPLEDIGLIN